MIFTIFYVIYIVLYMYIVLYFLMNVILTFFKIMRPNGSGHRAVWMGTWKGRSTGQVREAGQQGLQIPAPPPAHCHPLKLSLIRFSLFSGHRRTLSKKFPASWEEGKNNNLFSCECMTISESFYVISKMLFIFIFIFFKVWKKDEPPNTHSTSLKEWWAVGTHMTFAAATSSPTDLEVWEELPSLTNSNKKIPFRSHFCPFALCFSINPIPKIQIWSSFFLKRIDTELFQNFTMNKFFPRFLGSI